ncbi:GDA1/CD39 nucleoside phosphatase family protein [Nitzschia inconspicua]|uniref:GDA1/CD39 nucleoside phosphatase family protein n=1 Tax=Nitzschia inconspicua TaxID=303405 RepID=A0A9K3PRG2_9STRA|nr:GDA1/CD39 nucleoside phosphatase family protein [Nitzschia inconspicua]
MERHPIEAEESWRSFQEHQQKLEESSQQRRYLKHHQKHLEEDLSLDVDSNTDLLKLEQAKEKAYLFKVEKSAADNQRKAEKAHKKRMKELYTNSGIARDTVHGFMIDAGSTGSRIHLFEWEPRVLHSHRDVQDALSGHKLSFPNSQSRWSDRLRPGIASFASIKDDDELQKAVADYLAPLLEFAKMVLREKKDNFSSFPIFFRATAGMRTLDKNDRFRVLDAVRSLFNNPAYSPFYFEDEFARCLSGEEEAVFGFAGTNFIMGNLLQDSQGAGTVVNPRLTYGALDMGGASTQISFYEPHEDIMAGLFKLQIGQGKHWNIYAHSFLYFGMNEARGRFQAKLLAGYNDTARLLTGVDNPCLPGGSRQEVRLNIHYDKDGKETWIPQSGVSVNGFYQGLLKNDNTTGDFGRCLQYTRALLHLEDNNWCDFAHRNECSYNGVSMPDLPRQSEHFGEFLAISNYFHVWQFLGLPKKATLEQLYNSTEYICSMSKDELFEFNNEHAKVDDNDVEDYCFRSSYVFNVLRNGYGFEMDEHITATDVINGQKVGWALGAMLYEINTFPWSYERARDDELSDMAFTNASKSQQRGQMLEGVFMACILLILLAGLHVVLDVRRRRRNREEYLSLK